MALFVILYVAITLAMSSSLFDFYMKRKPRNKLLTGVEYYSFRSRNLGDRLLVLFSIPRNWYRFNHVSNEKSARDLRFLDCMKFFSMFLVIFAHTVWVLYEGAIANPQDPERMLHTVGGTLLISGSLITSTFFVISGFLLGLNWFATRKDTDEISLIQYAQFFIKFNSFRYIRLTVPYAVMILVSGFYFENPGSPLWRHIVEREQLCCRKNWWINILYLNNHINTNERCMLQSWYLAADTHCFLLGLVILMMADSLRWSRKANLLLGSTYAVFVALPGALSYINNYGPVFIPSPQTQRDSFIDSKDFNDFYTPFYMNFGCYLSGAITARIYKYLSEKHSKIRHYKIMHAMWFSLFPLGVLWLLSAHPFLQNYSDDISSKWKSIYAALHRNVWALGLCCLIIGMTIKLGWILREFATLPIFRILGRLTYGAFITHLCVLRIVLASIRRPIYLSTNVIFSFVLFSVVMSYLLSFVLAILVELPVTAILRLLRQNHSQ